MNELRTMVLLESDREIVTTRVLDSPRELVFDAFTDPVNI